MHFRNAFILHFCWIDVDFLASLSCLGINVAAISVPSFAIGDLDHKSIYGSHPDCQLFDVAGWMQSDITSSEVIQNLFTSDSGLIRSALYFQSLRLSHLSQLDAAERYIYIDVLLDRVYSFLTTHNIDLVCFGGIPHSLVDCAILYVAKRMGILSFILQDKPIAPQRCFAYDNELRLIDYTPDWEVEGCLRRLAMKICDTYTERKSFFIQNSNRQSPYIDIYNIGSARAASSLSQQLNRLIEEEPDNEFLKLSLTYFNAWVSNSLSIDDSYKLCTHQVIFYLHIEPESTVNPSAGIHHPYQITLIKQLRKVLSSDIRLLIREHPLMFTEKFREGVGFNASRPEMLLKTLVSLPNTFLLHPDCDSELLLENAAAAATLSGSVMYEYTMKRKPVIVHHSCQSCYSEVVHLWSQYGLIDSQMIVSWTAMLESMQDVAIAEEWLSNSLPGSPNAHLNMFYGINKGQEMRVNSIRLAKTISSLARHLSTIL
jgi:hypothetical protein